VSDAADVARVLIFAGPKAEIYETLQAALAVRGLTSGQFRIGLRIAMEVMRAAANEGAR